MTIDKRIVWVALGANVPGAWGGPRRSIDRALDELARAGIRIVCRSAHYRTPALGSVRQPDYVNAVAGLATNLGPLQLLRLLKRLERRAGRRVNGRWRARPLDLDILDAGGRRLGRPGRQRRAGVLLLPHPEMHRRGFVLVPLAEVAPGWRHPALGLTAKELLAQSPYLRHGVERLDP